MRLPVELQTFAAEKYDEIELQAERFSSYSPQTVDQGRILRWLRQFEPNDYEVMLKLLECVQYFDQGRVRSSLKQVHQMVRTELADLGTIGFKDVHFVGLGGPAESGESIARHYRFASQLGAGRFKLDRDLPKLQYEADSRDATMTLVFLDDFIGSGLQATRAWENQVSQLVTSKHRMYLGVIMAHPDGVDKVQSETPFRVITAHTVEDRNLLDKAPQFTAGEKKRILKYCHEIGNSPRGFEGLCALVSFFYGSPNNCPSALRGNRGQKKWKGILPRSVELP